MHLLVSATLLLQVAGSAPPTVPSSQARDSARARTGAAAAVDSARRRRPPRRIAVTPELDRSAFASPAARDMLLRARRARLAQDSALQSYDAKAYQRISVGMSLARVARERLLMRTENASRVRWSRDVGAWVELTGQRTAFPAVKGADGDVDIGDMSPVPYFPGRESLWFPSSDWSMARAEVDEREMVHPIATGAEAYYRYATGDSAALRLPGGNTVRLQELRVTARRPEWKLFVGSFWFDASTGQLVRAAYRMSAEMDIWKVASEEDAEERAERRARYEQRDSLRRTERGDTTPARRRRARDDDDDPPPAWVKAMLNPMRATISAITVEYGLHEGRFWMPRAHYAQGIAQAGFMRMPLKIEERFSYNSVNGSDPLPPLPPVAAADSATADSTGRMVVVNIGGGRDAAADSAGGDSTRRGRRRLARERQCAAGDSWVRRQSRADGAFAVGMRVPCDTTALARSPDLPPSIYDEGEALFGERERDELVSALRALQPGWAPAVPTVRSGLDLVRYNRVEGLSAGVLARQELGRGLSAEALARLGVGDWQPNGELALARSDGERTLRVAAYRRLAVANDWGAPLGFGASVGALLFGRDEGFYYRTYGAELARSSDTDGPLSWRLFAEHHDPARAETDFAVARGLANAAYPPNIDARRGTVAGAGARLHASRGVDPNGFRLLTDLRAEGAAGSFDYVRGAADATLSRPLGGSLAGALTFGAGTSGGTLPPQRQWYLGNSATVRGQRARPDAGGNAYWLGRAELGLNLSVVRPSLFYDLGWTGDRRDFTTPGRPLSGFGAGASLLDGMIRADVAKGVWPDRSVRGYLYLEARF